MNLNLTAFIHENNLSKFMDVAYKINLHEYELIGTHWIHLYVNVKNATYFHSFGVKHIPKKICKFIGNKNIIRSTHSMQAYH